MNAKTLLPLRASLAAIVLAASTLVTAVAVSPVAAASPVATVSPVAAYAWFSSPSKNIGCWMDASGARCDVLVHTYKPTKKPAYCHADWGTALEVGRTGKGHFGCVSDTVAMSPTILRYGHSKSFGRFTCTSRLTGMTCVNRYNGHGFKASKASYRFF
jgi:hypothetical protein